jgi:hypothetical protein
VRATNSLPFGNQHRETYLDEDQYGYAFVESDRDSKIHLHKKNKVTGKKRHQRKCFVY